MYVKQRRQKETTASNKYLMHFLMALNTNLAHLASSSPVGLKHEHVIMYLRISQIAAMVVHM